MGWYVYILLCGDGSLYTGISDRPSERLEAHRAGRGAKYTKGRGPLSIVYLESCAGRSEALSREAAVKKLTRLQKWALIGKAGSPRT
ncbi:MAG TPA: GIY-YIG nuclease family protein [Clostridiales bacterium]|nr:GIY-YIG nuclease family protein [Clostridiales bacterium]